MHRSPGPEASRSRRWLARLSLVLVGLAVVIVVAFARLASFAMVAVGVAGGGGGPAAGDPLLSPRGGGGRGGGAGRPPYPPRPGRVAAPPPPRAVGGWVAILAAGLWLLAGVTARLALAVDRGTDWRMPEYPAKPPAAHPFFIMNPKSGGGKVGKFDLKRKAEGLGAEVFLMDGPEEVDVAAVARDAVARGADLLGVAGGDGTQGLVAGVAARPGIPFVVITAGTRNH